MATPRDLVDRSARARLAAFGASIDVHSDVIRDGVACYPASASTRPLYRISDGFAVSLHLPELRAVSLGSVADQRGDGFAWTGRGTTLYGDAGVALDGAALHVVVTPGFWWTENRRFDFFPARVASRSSFASPFYAGEWSIDLPTRFGADPFTVFEPGNTAAWISDGRFDLGVGTSAQAWGPGLREHLLLGPRTASIPRVFLRTAAPRSTRFGVVSASTFLGRLTESRFFDNDPMNNARALWAWTVALSPTRDSVLAFGVAHGLLTVGSFSGPVDQMLTLYARARSRADRARAWVEIGRMGGLPPLRQFLMVPYQGIGYIVGIELHGGTEQRSVAFAAEAVNVEQPTDIRSRPSHDFYTSAAIPQGWTNRGRLLGVSTGPGSQSQFVSLDYVFPRWTAGVFGERVRWNEDAFFREPLSFQNRHDVTLRAGVRIAVSIGHYEATLELGSGKRLNYLFQNGTFIPGFRTVDLPLPQLRFSLVPKARL